MHFEGASDPARDRPPAFFHVRLFRLSVAYPIAGDPGDAGAFGVGAFGAGAGGVFRRVEASRCCSGVTSPASCPSRS